MNIFLLCLGTPHNMLTYSRVIELTHSAICCLHWRGWRLMTRSMSPNFNQVKPKPLTTRLLPTAASAYMQTHLPHDKLNNKFYDGASVHIVDNDSSPPNPCNHKRVQWFLWNHDYMNQHAVQHVIQQYWSHDSTKCRVTWQCRRIHWSSTLNMVFSVIWHLCH